MALSLPSSASRNTPRASYGLNLLDEGGGAGGLVARGALPFEYLLVDANVVDWESFPRSFARPSCFSRIRVGEGDGVRRAFPLPS